MICILIAATIAANIVRLEPTADCYPTYQECRRDVPNIARRRPAPVADRPEAFRCVRAEAI